MEKSVTLNVLHFEHPAKELTFDFTTQEIEGAYKVKEKDCSFLVAKLKLPKTTKALYTTFHHQTNNGFTVTQKTCCKENELKEACWSYSILKTYYTQAIYAYFGKQFPVSYTFVGDVEVWIPEQSGYSTCHGYHVFGLRVQFARITNQPELIVYSGDARSVFKESLTSATFHEMLPEVFTRVMFENRFYRYDDMPDKVRRHLDHVYPCINKRLKKALGMQHIAPDQSNKYIRYFDEIEAFKNNFLLTPPFRSLLPLEHDWVNMPSFQFADNGTDQAGLIFGGDTTHEDSYTGIKEFGPKELIPKQDKDVVFFFICHENDTQMALTVNDFMLGEKRGFRGLANFAKIRYVTQKGLSIYFKNKENPLPEIITQLNDGRFDGGTRYVALYLSPYSKWSEQEEDRAIYYRVKEELLHRGIVSQALEVEKTWGTNRVLDQKSKKAILDDNFKFSLPNIAIALLAKLGGTPWSLPQASFHELVIGISAFKNLKIGKKYLGSAFSFSNEGKFYGFDVFRSDQINELAGSILLAVRRYCEEHHEMKRLVIHFYKTLSWRELAPIEKGLAELGLNVPVVVVSMNKAFSEDIVGFDLSYAHKMPDSGTYLAIGRNEFLLYNNGFAGGVKRKGKMVYPFPLKLSIQQYESLSKANESILETTAEELLQQVSRFSCLYWKSVSHQPLPVTLKYPEMLAQIVPHFTRPELPQTGKKTLWFL